MCDASLKMVFFFSLPDCELVKSLSICETHPRTMISYFTIGIELVTLRAIQMIVTPSYLLPKIDKWSNVTVFADDNLQWIHFASEQIVVLFLRSPNILRLNLATQNRKVEERKKKKYIGWEKNSRMVCCVRDTALLYWALSDNLTEFVCAWRADCDTVGKETRGKRCGNGLTLATGDWLHYGMLWNGNQTMSLPMNWVNEKADLFPGCARMRAQWSFRAVSIHIWMTARRTISTTEHAKQTNAFTRARG